MTFALLMARIVGCWFLFVGIAAIAAGIEYQISYLGGVGAVSLGIFAVLEKVSQ